MDFFGDYSIETASCHPSALQTHADDMFSPNEMPPSPLSRRGAHTSYPSSIVNMTDLTKHFTLQSLDATCTLDSPPSSPAYDTTVSYSATRSLLTPLSPTRRTSTTTSRTIPCWKRRVQRQNQVRLLTDAAHLQSISDMVHRMTETSPRPLSSRRTTPTPATPLIDEEDDDDDQSDSESGSPRSLSSSSSNGRHSAYLSAVERTVVVHRRSDGNGACGARGPRSPGIQKTRSKRATRR